MVENLVEPWVGSSAVVTGGGTGVGAEVCRGLVARGATRIAIVYSRSAADADALAAELSSDAVDAFAIQADVGDDPAVRALFAEITERWGELDYLVNNAGATRLVPFAELDAVTEEDWNTVFDVNIKGAFFCARAAAPLLRARSGAIVNVSSVAAYAAMGSSIPYGVSKAGLLQLTRSLARVLAPEVRVNAVSPGAIQSRWLEDLMGAEKAQAFKDSEAADTPLGRVAEAAEVADAVLSMLAVRFVTGEDVIVDGGKHTRY
ncbi:SDR family NAD(P)-dependent oxidoreductase [uncultured Schumannella sp.]|uniref:SDR family NAD(P)-dependent oxidoreductase n=1 Tax=uncultured Schumannella sp. TaxID=1195956 RepID=UPI0025FD406D|nr:SDR family oxidoreductase [uncultured Schumannella sp.]